MSKKLAKEISKPNCTHGIGLGTRNPTNAISKILEVSKWDDGHYQFSFETVWSEGELPVKTNLSLSAEAVDLIFECLTRLMFNQNDYALVDSKKED